MTLIKYPKNEVTWVEYYTEEHVLKYIITSKPNRETYFAYEVLPDGALKKLGSTTKNPKELEQKYILDNLYIHKTKRKKGE